MGDGAAVEGPARVLVELDRLVKEREVIASVVANLPKSWVEVRSSMNETLTAAVASALEGALTSGVEPCWVIGRRPIGG